MISKMIHGRKLILSQVLFLFLASVSHAENDGMLRRLVNGMTSMRSVSSEIGRMGGPRENTCGGGGDLDIFSAPSEKGFETEISCSIQCSSDAEAQSAILVRVFLPR